MQLKESCVIIRFSGWQWGLVFRISWVLLKHSGAQVAPKRPSESESGEEQHEPFIESPLCD